MADSAVRIWAGGCPAVRAGYPQWVATGWLAAFDAGVSAYLEGDFIVAQTHLADARELNPDDVMATMLAQRCRRLALGHGGLWTGAWKLSDGQGGK